MSCSVSTDWPAHATAARGAVRGATVRRGFIVRALYLAMSVAWYVLQRSTSGAAHRTVVLCYHGVKPHQAARFAWQVRRAAARAIGVQALTTAGARPRSAPTVCFTFDDAFANLCDNALPILRERGVPACIFAVSDNLGARPRWRIAPDHPEAREPVMTADQLQQVVGDSLFTLGSHTCTHPDLAEVSIELAARELRESRRQLSALAGRPVDDLALPHGSFTPAIIDAAFAAGYQRVFTLEPVPHQPVNDRQTIGRFLMSPDAWRLEFLLTCAGAYGWLSPWRRFVRRARRWRAGPARRPAIA